jgi:hypothetical protein
LERQSSKLLIRIVIDSSQSPRNPHFVTLNKPLPFRGGVGVGTRHKHQRWELLRLPTPVPSPEGEG